MRRGWGEEEEETWGLFTRDQNCQTDSLTVALNLEALAWRKRQFSRSLPLSLFHLGGSQSTPSTPDGCVLCEHPGSRLVGGLVGPSWFCWCCVAGSGCFGCAGPAPSPKIDNCCRIGVEKKHLHHCPAVLSHHRMSYLSFSPLLSTGKKAPRGLRLLF